jgi:serine/threonine protein kinase
MDKRLYSYQEGEKIGERYQVIKANSGGSAEVFLCKDTINQHTYALKTIKQKYLNSQRTVARFYKEAEYLLALSDQPNIVRCYWIEEIDSRPFIFLEWVGHGSSQSSTLRKWMRHQNLDRRFALNVAIDICKGLQQINQILPNLVHCDLKPTNILITHNQTAKICDFSHARYADEHRLLGTDQYAAPELWLKESVDIRTDIYAIGCILYELLIGQKLFNANSNQEYKQLHLESPIPQLSKRTNLSPIVDEILAKCLAKDRRDRFADVQELLDLLIIFYKDIFSEAPKQKVTRKKLVADDLINRGYAYFNLQKYDLALDCLDKAINHDANIANAYAQSGLVLVRKKQYHQAINKFTQALQIDYFNTSYFANRAFCYTQIENYVQAISDYNDAIKRSPHDLQLHLNRAYVYLCLNQFDEALDDYSYVIESDVNNGEVYVHRAGLHYKLMNFKGAISDYTMAIEKNPQVVKLYQCRALAVRIQVRIGMREMEEGSIKA